jgi:hypothetical protein
MVERLSNIGLWHSEMKIELEIAAVALSGCGCDSLNQ